MQLYSLKKNLHTPRMARYDFSSISFRRAAQMVLMISAVFLNPAVYAEDPSEISPEANSLEALSKPRPTVKSDIELVSRPLIAGLWGMTIPNVSCIEYYNFREDGRFIVKSAGEWSLGKYVYQLPEMEAMSNSLPQLTMGILYDSNVTDCSGNNINQTGEVQQEFVKWISPSHIQFCATPEGTLCPLDLHRVLP